MQPIKIQTETIRDQVYRILKTQIINGTYHPGEKLAEKIVADQLGVSRSPVREAIKQLVGEGLLEYLPNRGAHVRRYTSKDVTDSFAVRRLLEEYAVTHVSEEMRQLYMDEMRQLCKKLKTAQREDYLDMDAATHTLVIRLCNNGALQNIYQTIFSQISTFREISLIDNEAFYNSTRAHMIILEDLMAGDDLRALKVIHRHLEDAEKRVQVYYGKNDHDELKT